MEMELGVNIKAPFRAQPRVAQAGSALIVAGVLLFTLVMPLHLVGVVAFTSADGAAALWGKLFLGAFMAAFLAFGVYMSQSLIRLGYELARPETALLIIAAGTLVVQAIAALVGFSMPLLLVELFGIPICVVGGFIVYSAGMELRMIARCQSVGGGLGALVGLVWGFVFAEGQLALTGSILLGGLAAEGLGRMIRIAIRHVRKRTEVSQDGASARDQAHAA